MERKMTCKEQLLDAVKGLTYKPGWTFAVEDYIGLGLDERIIALNIKVDATCVDSRDPITIDRSFVYKTSSPEEFVAGCIEEIEEHEIHEWLKFNGKRYFPEPDHG